MSLLHLLVRNGGIRLRNLKQFKMMLLAQLKLTFREKQAWFWGIFFPVILMTIFMIIFSGEAQDDFSAKVAIVDENPNPTSEMLLTHISQIPILEIETGEPISRDQADELVNEKEIEAAIILPPSEDSTSLMLVVNKENEQGVTTQALSGMLDKLVQQANLSAVGAAPIFDLQLETTSASTNELNFTDFLLTGMIALSIAQGGLFGMIDLVEMRRKGLIKRLRMTPANMTIFGLSDMMMRLLFGVIQIFLLSIIGVFVFGATLYINFFTLLIVFLLGALSFNAMGYFVSSFSKTSEAYMGVANITSFIMMFLSGVFIPIETLPNWIRPFSNILPLTYFVEGLREAMLYSSTIFSVDIWIGVGITVLWGAVAFIIGSMFYKRKSIVSVR